MKYFLLFFIAVFQFSQAQNEFLDYAITTSNDTVYGLIKKKQLHFIKKSNAMLSSINLNDVKSIRKDDVVYFKTLKPKKYSKTYLKDFISEKKTLQDYIVTTNNDSIYGDIKNPLFGSKYIKGKNNIRVNISKRDALSYRYKNQAYDLKKLDTSIVYVEKSVFLKQIIKGKVSLYTYKVLKNDVGSINPTTFYIIEKKEKLYLISNSNYKQQLVDLFIDNNELVELIDNDFYTLGNIYLIVKMYNFTR